MCGNKQSLDAIVFRPLTTGQQRKRLSVDADGRESLSSVRRQERRTFIQFSGGKNTGGSMLPEGKLSASILHFKVVQGTCVAHCGQVSCIRSRISVATSATYEWIGKLLWITNDESFQSATEPHYKMRGIATGGSLDKTDERAIPGIFRYKSTII